MQDLTKCNPSQGRAGLLQSHLWLHLPSIPSSWLLSRKEQSLHCCFHDPPWRLMGFLKREQVHGQNFPLRSRFLGSCSGKPSLVSWLAFPQRRIISPSSPLAVTGSCSPTLEAGTCCGTSAEARAPHGSLAGSTSLTKALAPLLAVSVRSKGPPGAHLHQC